MHPFGKGNESAPNLARSRPKTALFGNLGVDLRISLCGVQEYASAQILDLLDLARKSLVFASGTAPSPPEFPDGNGPASCIFPLIGMGVRTPDDEAPASVDFAHPSPIMKYWTLRSTER